MSDIKCFDVLDTIIDEANKRFAPRWIVNNEKSDILKEYCDAIDFISQEIDIVEIEAEIDEESMEIIITIGCEGEIIVQSESNTFYDLIERTVRFAFSAPHDDALLVKFVFPGIWDRV